MSKKPKQGDLYKITDNKKDANNFGTFVAIDQDGKYVLNVDGKYAAFDEAIISKVMPWTFSVQYCAGRSGTIGSFQGEKDSVSVNDVLVTFASENCGPAVCVVTHVDTQDESALTIFDGLKLSSAILQAAG